MCQDFITGLLNNQAANYKLSMRQICNRINLSPIPRLDSDQQQSTTGLELLCSTSDPVTLLGEKNHNKKNERKNGVKQKITQHFRQQGFEVLTTFLNKSLKKL